MPPGTPYTRICSNNSSHNDVRYTPKRSHHARSQRHRDKRRYAQHTINAPALYRLYNGQVSCHPHHPIPIRLNSEDVVIEERRGRSGCFATFSAYIRPIHSGCRFASPTRNEHPARGTYLGVKSARLLRVAWPPRPSPSGGTTAKRGTGQLTGGPQRHAPSVALSSCSVPLPTQSACSMPARPARYNRII